MGKMEACEYGGNIIFPIEKIWKKAKNMISNREYSKASIMPLLFF